MLKKALIAFIFFEFFCGTMLSGARAADSIKIGIMLPLTGRLASFGQIQNKAVRMAAGEVNAGGGINGRKIELIEADTEGNLIYLSHFRGGLRR